MLVSCDQYRVMAGAGYHSNDYDSPQWQHENPIGHVKAEANNYIGERVMIGTFYEHNSEFLESDSTGFNLIGIHAGYVWGKQ